MKTEHCHWLLLLSFLVLVALLIVSLRNSDPIPWSFDNHRSNEFAYEGFESFRQQPSPLTYGTLPGQPSLDVDLNSIANSDKKIDFFYPTDSSEKCAGSGYTKSKGNLCLNDEQRSLLTTRGGNVSNKDSQIG